MSEQKLFGEISQTGDRDSFCFDTDLHAWQGLEERATSSMLAATLYAMNTVTLDFVAREPDNSIWSLILVEQGPWEQEEIEENLRKLQNRLYDCIDIAVDGIFAKEYPDSIGKEFVIRVDGYELPGNDVSEFFKSFAESVLEIKDYKSALRESAYVNSIIFEINLEESSNGI